MHIYDTKAPPNNGTPLLINKLEADIPLARNFY